MRIIERKLIRGNRGQASVELMLSAVFLFTAFLGATQLLVLMYAYVSMAEAAKEGVRYAIVHGSNASPSSGPTCPCTNVENVVKTYVNYSSMTISVTYPDSSNDPPKRVRIELSYPFTLFRLGWSTVTVRAAAEGRIFY